MAQTQLYAKKAQITIAEEVTVDTYVAPDGAGTGMFLAEEVTVAWDSSNYEPNQAHGDFLQMDEVPGPCSGTMSFRVPIKGSGTAGTAPEYAEALKACGYEETVVPATSVTYTPLSTFDGAGGNPGQSYSVSLLLNGIRYAIKGSFGNAVISGNVTGGEPGFLDFAFQGAYVAVADDALESPTYQTTTAPSFLGATFAMNFGGAHTPKGINNFSLDTGNQITIGRDINESSGIYGARITGRRSFGSFDPEMQLVATEDYHGTWRAGTSGTITTGAIGSTAGNIWTLSVARAVLRPISNSNREGIHALEIPFGVSSIATDVEGTNADVSLVYT